MPSCWNPGGRNFTDSQVIKDSKILEQQNTFSQNDISSKKTFANVYDKGFHNAGIVIIEGQTYNQPKYSKGDVQFQRDE